MKATIAWIVIDRDYPDIKELYLKEPPEYKLDYPDLYDITKIVYFEVE